MRFRVHCRCGIFKHAGPGDGRKFIICLTQAQLIFMNRIMWSPPQQTCSTSLLSLLLPNQRTNLECPHCFKSIPPYNKLSAAHSQYFHIQFHQMLKISIQFFFRKTGEKFRLRASVNFTDAVDQLPVAHSDILQNYLAAPLTYPVSTD
jgi:hypothetical protein